jgi:ankyrin repeat protein
MRGRDEELYNALLNSFEQFLKIHREEAVRKNQGAIFDKLHQELKLRGDITMDDFLQNPAMSKGHCFGVALVRAVMSKVLNKLDWWDALRDEIVKWEGDEASLNKEVLLPGAKDNKPVLLRSLFERASHYLIFNQANVDQYPYFDFVQSSFLLPGGPFELLVESANGKEVITKIKNHYRCLGNLTDEITTQDLIKSLEDQNTKDAIKNNICLVHSLEHACELSYSDGKWYFFDPNYENGMAKSFDTLNDLIQEMKTILGSKISIEIATIDELDEKKKPFRYYYEDILYQHPEKLIDNDGLFTMIVLAPEQIPILLERLNSAQFKFDMEQYNSNGQTLLIEATLTCQVDTIEAFLTNGADPNLSNGNGWTALTTAAPIGHVETIKTLIKHGADPNLLDDNGSTALTIAASNGQVEAVEALIENGADPNVANTGNSTPLYEAMRSGQIKVMELLLEKGADPNAVYEGSTPLHEAARSNNIKAVKALIMKGAEVNQDDSDARTPLTIATVMNHTEVIEVLLKNGADPNITNDGIAPLHDAAGGGHIEATELLLTNRADPNVTNNDNSTPLHEAALGGHIEIIEALIKHGANPHLIDSNGLTPLTAAASNDHAEAIEVLLKNGAKPTNAEIDKIMENGDMLLKRAVETGCSHTVKFLLDRGANPNRVDADGETPFMNAASTSNLDTFETLLRSGATPNKEVVEILLQKEANPPDLYDPTEYLSPLHMAATKGHIKTIELFLNHGADPNATDHTSTLLHKAAGSGRIDAIELIIKNGADPNTDDRSSSTPLHYAARDDHADAIELLIKHGANPNAVDNMNSTPLHEAVRGSHVNAIKSLIKNHADLNAIDGINFTPLNIALIEAAEIGRIDVVELLLEKGANIGAEIDNTVIENGEMLLKKAAETGCSHTVKFLLDKGVQPSNDALLSASKYPDCVKLINDKLEKHASQSNRKSDLVSQFQNERFYSKSPTTDSKVNETDQKKPQLPNK